MRIQGLSFSAKTPVKGKQYEWGGFFIPDSIGFLSGSDQNNNPNACLPRNFSESGNSMGFA
jgi:hypothetical protein